MILSVLMMWIGLFGLFSNRGSIIRMLISVEVFLVGLLLLCNTISVHLDDISGLVLGLMVLGIAGGESAIGLAMLIKYNRGGVLRRIIKG